MSQESQIDITVFPHGGNNVDEEERVKSDSYMGCVEMLPIYQCFYTN